jgi:hypothetical protein
LGGGSIQVGCQQGDQIGRNFAIWAIFNGIGRFFIEKIAQ